MGELGKRGPHALRGHKTPPTFYLTVTVLLGIILRPAHAGEAETEKPVAAEEPSEKETEGEPAHELEEIVVTARRRDAVEFDVARHVSVVDAERIREAGGQTTPDALREEPGVHVQKTCLGAGSPFIRGLTGKQVLILVDGVRLNNSTFRFGPNQYLNTIDPNLVDRMEVVRGPGSVLYGSDALGGVINVLTRKQGRFGETPEPGTEMRLYEQFSSADTGSVTRVDVEGPAGVVDYTVGAGYKFFGDLRAGRGESPVGAVDIDGVQSPTGYEEVDANASVRYPLSQNQELRAAVLFSRQFDVPRSDKVIASDYNTNPEDKYLYDPQQLALGYVEYEARDLGALAALECNVSCNNQLEGRERRKAGWTKTRFEEDNVSTVGATVQANFKPVASNLFTGGIEFYQDWIDSWRKEVADAGGTTWLNGRFPDNTTYATFGAYVQDEIDLGDKFDVSLGGRFSAFSIDADFQGLTIPPLPPLDEVHKTYSDFTWSAEGVYHASEGSNVYLNVARGFRAPNVDDLAVSGDWSSGEDVPNPDLDPEQVVNYEVGYKYAAKNVKAGVAYFFGDYTDLIQRSWLDAGPDLIVGTTDDLYQFDNVAKAQIQGVELWGRWVHERPSGTYSVFGNFSWTHGQNLMDDEPVRRIPPAQGIVGLRWDEPRKHGWAELFVEGAAKQDRLSSGDVSDNRIPAGGTPGWMTVNLRGGAKLTRKVTATLGAYNLGDARYRVHGSGIDAPGLNVVVGLECRF